MSSNEIKVLENGWMEVPFSYMAEHISKRVDPKDTDLDVYIGLEHIDPGSLKIKRYGKPEDVKGTKLIAKPGDIIFGKRRAYQGKVGVCEWDAIVSAHSMVLRSKEGNIEKDFLKFFMQSEEFYNRSIQISEGSLSPTIKWKILSNEKFIIPDKKKQKELINNINSIENVINSLKKVLENTIVYKTSLTKHLLLRGVNNECFKESVLGNIPINWKISKLSDVCYINPKKFNVDDNEIQVSFIGMEDISNEGKIINMQKDKYKNIEKGFTSFIENDVLVAKITPCFENGKGALCKNLKNKIGFGSTEFHVLRCKKDVIPEFVFIHTQTSIFRKLGEWNMTGSAGQRRVPKEFIEEYLITVPPIQEQRKIVSIIDSISYSIINLKENIHYSERLKLDLVNKLLT